MTEEHRLKIKDANILSDLIEFFKGQRKLEPLRVHVGLALLKKVLPDLTQNDGTVDHQVTVRAIRFLTEQEWLTRKAQQTLTIAQGGNSSLSTPATNGSQSVSVTEGQERH